MNGQFSPDDHTRKPQEGGNGASDKDATALERLFKPVVALSSLVVDGSFAHLPDDEYLPARLEEQLEIIAESPSGEHHLFFKKLVDSVTDRSTCDHILKVARIICLSDTYPGMREVVRHALGERQRRDILEQSESELKVREEPGPRKTFANPAEPTSPAELLVYFLSVNNPGFCTLLERMPASQALTHRVILEVSEHIKEGHFEESDGILELQPCKAFLRIADFAPPLTRYFVQNLLQELLLSGSEDLESGVQVVPNLNCVTLLFGLIDNGPESAEIVAEEIFKFAELCDLNEIVPVLNTIQVIHRFGVEHRPLTRNTVQGLRGFKTFDEKCIQWFDEQLQVLDKKTPAHELEQGRYARQVELMMLIAAEEGFGFRPALINKLLENEIDHKKFRKVLLRVDETSESFTAARTRLAEQVLLALHDNRESREKFLLFEDFLTFFAFSDYWHGPVQAQFQLLHHLNESQQKAFFEELKTCVRTEMQDDPRSVLTAILPQLALILNDENISKDIVTQIVSIMEDVLQVPPVYFLLEARPQTPLLRYIEKIYKRIDGHSEDRENEPFLTNCLKLVTQALKARNWGDLLEEAKIPRTSKGVEICNFENRSLTIVSMSKKSLPYIFSQLLSYDLMMGGLVTAICPDPSLVPCIASLARVGWGGGVRPNLFVPTVSMSGDKVQGHLHDIMNSIGEDSDRVVYSRPFATYKAEAEALSEGLHTVVLPLTLDIPRLFPVVDRGAEEEVADPILGERYGMKPEALRDAYKMMFVLPETSEDIDTIIECFKDPSRFPEESSFRILAENGEILILRGL